MSPDYHAILIRAHASAYGICVTSTSPERLRTKLYNERKKHPHDFPDLSFALSPTHPLTDLWIIHNAKDE